MKTQGITRLRSLGARPGTWILGAALALSIGTGTPRLSAGRKDFEQADALVGNRRLPDAETLSVPGGVAVDPTSGKVFVMDSAHHRVLRYPASAGTGSGVAAEAVLGQPDLVSAIPRTTQDGLREPWRGTVDSAGRLWVLDAGNYRVMRWDNASSVASGAPANQVLGQPDFVSRSNGGAGRMSQPNSLAVDASGRLWVADARGRRVLRFDNAVSKPDGGQPEGVLGQPNLTTFNTGLTARDFEEVSDLATDSQGRLWVVDTGNNRILRFDSPAAGNHIDANGVLGQPDFVSNNSTFGESTMGYVVSVVVSADGTVFGGDYGGQRVVHWKNGATRPNGAPVSGVLGRVGPEGNAVRPEGNSTGFTSVAGMAVDAAGRLWVADWYEERVMRWDAAASRTNGAPANGVIGFANTETVYRPDPTTGPIGPVALLQDPASGKVFVAEYARVLRYGSRTAMELGAPAEAVLGKGRLDDASTGAASDTNLGSVGGLALDNTGRLWVSDPDRNRIVSFDNALSVPTGSRMSRVLGQPTFTASSSSTSPTGLSAPHGLALDASGSLWVADSGNNRVVRFDQVSAKANGAAANAALGQPDLSTSTTGTEAGRMNSPKGLAIDSGGRLWVADTGRNRVLRYDNPSAAPGLSNPSGELGGVASVGPSGMSTPQAVAITHAGRLWVADTGLNRILRFEAAASKTNRAPADGVLGAPMLDLSVPGARTLEQFNQPWCVSLDAMESLWVADYNNGRLLRFTPDSLARIEQISKTAAGKARVRFTTSGAGSFVVQSSTDLRTWIDEQSYKLGSGAEQIFERTADGSTRSFRIFEP